MGYIHLVHILFEEAIISDRLAYELRLVILDPFNGLWCLRDEIGKKIRHSSKPMNSINVFRLRMFNKAQQYRKYYHVDQLLNSLEIAF